MWRIEPPHPVEVEFATQNPAAYKQMKKLMLIALLFTGTFTTKAKDVTVTFNGKVPDSIKRTVIHALDTCRIYTSGTVVVDYAPIPADTTPQGAPYSVECEYRKIHINSIAFDKGYTLDELSCDVTLETLLSRGQKTKYPKTPIETDFGGTIFKIVSWQGLSFSLLRGTDTIPSTFFLMACGNALSLTYFKGTHFQNYPAHYALGVAIKQMIDSQWISVSQIIKCQRKSQVYSFVGYILNKKAKKVTNEDITLVFKYLVNVYGKKTEEAAMRRAKIIEIRKQ